MLAADQGNVKNEIYRDESLFTPLIVPIINRFAVVIPSRADGEGPHRGCLIIQASLCVREDCVGSLTSFGMTADHLHHWSTQSFTVLYQSWLFCGLSTQWPSSGKYNIFDGTLSTCSVVNRSKPCETSSR